MYPASDPVSKPTSKPIPKPVSKPVSIDDRPTLAALGILAFALANVAHEALGHGLATLAVGDKAVLLTTCYFTSDGNYSKWIPAAGGLMNLAFGLVSLAVLRLGFRLLPQSGPRSQYFLILIAAFNLFFAFGYPAYSGIAQFGDWSTVISGLHPQWLWRVLLVVVAVAGYYASMQLIARAIAPFAATAGAPSGSPLDKARLRRITLIPYLAAIVLACLAGSLNPNGWRTMLTSGLPAAAAAFGLTQLDHLLTSTWNKAESIEPADPAQPIQRSYPWIIAAIAVLIFFVGVLGPGIRFR